MKRYSFRVTEGKYSDSDLAVDLPDKFAAPKESARHVHRSDAERSPRMQPTQLAA